MAEYISKRVANVINDQFSYLWKEDPDWLKQRQEDWLHIEKVNIDDYTKKRKGQLKKLFLKGVYPGHTRLLILSIPFDSSDTMRDFFYSDALTASERANISFFNLSDHFLSGLSWERDFNRMYVEGVLGREYEEKKEALPGGGDRIISPNPSCFCDDFIFFSYKLLLLKELKYTPYVEAVDYFVTALPFFTDPDWRNERRHEQFNKMLALSDTVSKKSDAPPIAKELAEKIVNRKEEIVRNWDLNSHLDD